MEIIFRWLLFSRLPGIVTYPDDLKKLILPIVWAYELKFINHPIPTDYFQLLPYAIIPIDLNPSLINSKSNCKAFRIPYTHVCHHPANSIIPVSYTLNLHYIITMLKSFNIKKY